MQTYIHARAARATTSEPGSKKFRERERRRCAGANSREQDKKSCVCFSNLDVSHGCHPRDLVHGPEVHVDTLGAES